VRYVLPLCLDGLRPSVKRHEIKVVRRTGNAGD